MIYLDTHVVMWLAAGDEDHLSERAVEALDGDELRLSPMVRLELQYLDELKRLVMRPAEILSLVQNDFAISICTAPFDAVVHAAQMMGWTRDPFDRLITAQAALADVPLLTKDAVIRKHYAKAVW